MALPIYVAFSYFQGVETITTTQTEDSVFTSLTVYSCTFANCTRQLIYSMNVWLNLSNCCLLKSTSKNDKDNFAPAIQIKGNKQEPEEIGNISCSAFSEINADSHKIIYIYNSKVGSNADQNGNIHKIFQSLNFSDCISSIQATGGIIEMNYCLFHSFQQLYSASSVIKFEHFKQCSMNYLDFINTTVANNKKNKLISTSTTTGLLATNIYKDELSSEIGIHL